MPLLLDSSARSWRCAFLPTRRSPVSAFRPNFASASAILIKKLAASIAMRSLRSGVAKASLTTSTMYSNGDSSLSGLTCDVTEASTP